MKFKEVAHLYLGCKMSHKWSSLHEEVFITLDAQRLKLGTTDFIPILRPLSDMTDEEKKTSSVRYQPYPMLPWEFKYLLSKNFDLFGLIEAGEAIDAKILETNPYRP